MKHTAVAVLAILAAGRLGAAQEPREGQPPARELEATIVALKGAVDVKRPEDKDWVPAARDMRLRKGSEICTAVASSATLLFHGAPGTAGRLTVEVRSLTQVRVEELVRVGPSVNAGVQLKFGAIEVDIQKGDLKADMKVAAPNSTTSVSGSHGLVRAPARQGLSQWVVLEVSSGKWAHFTGLLELAFAVEDYGWLTNWGLSDRELAFVDFLWQAWGYPGRRPEELGISIFDVGANPIDPFLVPPYEVVSPRRPAGGVFYGQPSIPLPPPPPPNP
jgi:hypothetical protein